MTASQTQIEVSPRPSLVDAYLLNAPAMSAKGWKAWCDLIEPVMKLQHEYTMRTLFDDARAERVQPWAIVDRDTDLVVGAMATRVCTYQSGMTACIVMAGATGGTNVTWECMRSVLETVEAFAKDCGCDILRIMGRPGWARLFKDYKTTYICLDKTLSEVQS